MAKRKRNIPDKLQVLSVTKLVAKYYFLKVVRHFMIIDHRCSTEL